MVAPRATRRRAIPAARTVLIGGIAPLRAIVDALFATREFDLRSVAIALLERRGGLLDEDDAPWLVELARRGACWAHVDYVVTQVLGPLLERHPRGFATKVRLVHAF